MNEVPRRVMRQAEYLEEKTGECTSVTQEDGHWIIRLSGERVQLEAHFKGNDAVPQGAVVTVDGQEHDFTRDVGQFVRVFQNPGLLAGEPLIPLPEKGAPDREIPADIRRYCGIIRKAVPFPVTAFRSAEGWTIGMDAGEGNGIRLFFIRAGQRGKRWTLDLLRPFQLYASGDDYTAECQGRIERALAKLAESAAAARPEGDSAVGASEAKSVNSVRERRHAVIRNLEGK